MTTEICVSWISLVGGVMILCASLSLNVVILAHAKYTEARCEALEKRYIKLLADGPPKPLTELTGLTGDAIRLSPAAREKGGPFHAGELKASGMMLQLWTGGKSCRH
ncbi:MAG: hypothetical protein PF795_00730 [Kiritimatiellae bacterium]|jgi:hypothetical protein|nr:hypothetical protein [Kiritimatiellia bacterium]